MQLTGISLSGSLDASLSLLSEHLPLGWVISPHPHFKDGKLVCLNDRPRPEGLAPKGLCLSTFVSLSVFYMLVQVCLHSNNQYLEST